MNQLHILVVGTVSIAVALAAIGIFNHTYAQDNATIMTGNMTGGNATIMTGNMTGGNMTGNMTAMDENATGTISKRGQ